MAQVFSCEFCEISMNTYFYRIPPVATSVLFQNWGSKSNIYCKLDCTKFVLYNISIQTSQTQKTERSWNLCRRNGYLKVLLGGREGGGGGILGQKNEKKNTQIKTQDLNERYLHMLENCLLSFIALINYNNYYLLHKRLNCKAYLRQKKQAKIQMKSCVFLKICFFGFECKNIKTHSKENHKLIFSAEAYA